MQYHSEKLDDLIQNYNQFSVIVLHGKNESKLVGDFKKMVHDIAGPSAFEEMRISNFYDEDIKDKTDQILLQVESRGFFKGPNVITIKNLTEKNEKIILEIEKIWRPEDSLTIVSTEKLSKKSKLLSLIQTSRRIACLRYFYSPIDRKQLGILLSEKHLTLKDEATFNVLHTFAQNSSRSLLEDTIDKLSLYKFNDKSPINIDDFTSSACLGYETDDVELASAIAEDNLSEICKNLKLIEIAGKNPAAIMHFLYVYFRKIYLIQLYGETDYKVKKEFPFLFGKDLIKAKKYARNWGKEKLQKTLNFLAIADFELRKKDSSYSFMLFSEYVFKMGRL